MPHGPCHLPAVEDALERAAFDAVAQRADAALQAATDAQDASAASRAHAVAARARRAVGRTRAARAHADQALRLASARDAVDLAHARLAAIDMALVDGRVAYARQLVDDLPLDLTADGLDLAARLAHARVAAMEGRPALVGPLADDLAARAPGSAMAHRAAWSTALAHAVADGPAAPTAPLAALQRTATDAGWVRLAADSASLVARILTDQRDYRRAQAAHQEVLEQHTRHRDVGGVVGALGGLGLCAVGTGQPALGVQRLTQAVTKARSLGALGAEAAWRRHLDEALVHLERYPHRIRELKRYLQVATALEDDGLTHHLLHAVGQSYRQMGEPSEAVPWLRRALGITRQRGGPTAADAAWLGIALAESGVEDEARGLLQAALAEAPTEAEPFGAARRMLARPPG